MTALAPAGWELAPHVCRLCGGRVVRQADLFRCSGCGNECRGVSQPGIRDLVPKAICGCGMPGAWRGRARPRCAPNPQRSPWNPAEYVIATGDADAQDA